MKEYKDEERLRRLHFKKGLSQSEIADKFNCSNATICLWFDKFGIDTVEPKKRKPAYHTFDQTTGYEKWRTRVCDKRKTVMVHHLVLVAEGEDPTIVFSDEYDTHHKNGFPFDNRPSNLELVEKEEHGRQHANERWS